jgi:hypothetical protein
MRNHIVKDHEGKYNHHCSYCDKGFMKLCDLDNHILFRHQGIRTGRLLKEACPYCGKTYTPKALTNHLREHEGGLLDCKFHECKKSFNSTHSLNIHVRTVHEKVRIKCSKCERLFRNGTLLRAHLLCEHEGVRWSCDLCGKQLKSKVLLLNHKRQIHAGIRHPCLHCSQSFSQKHSLAYHVRLKHSSEERFRCEKCDKKFVIPWKMRDHVRKCRVGAENKIQVKNEKKCTPTEISTPKPTQTNVQTIIKKDEDALQQQQHHLQIQQTLSPHLTQSNPSDTLITHNGLLSNALVTTCQMGQLSIVNSVQDFFNQSQSASRTTFNQLAADPNQQVTFLAIIPS